jgi:protein-S-isoprenylcysteine O-methyltransferase Ste14
MVIAHAFVLLYEEPTLQRMFGDEYREYCRRVRRW